MKFARKTVGFALTGSFCTIADVLPQIKCFVDAGANVIPILSNTVAQYDTRFGKAADLREKLMEMTRNAPITTIPEAEPIGPRALLDLLVVAPCTGNTLAKIAYGITDTPVTMAVKAHLRNEKPVVLSLSTNDALSGNAKNIGHLLNVKHIYFVPFKQDDPEKKARSVISDNTLILPTAAKALQGLQAQPILI